MDTALCANLLQRESSIQTQHETNLGVFEVIPAAHTRKIEMTYSIPYLRQHYWHTDTCNLLKLLV